MSRSERKTTSEEMPFCELLTGSRLWSARPLWRYGLAVILITAAVLVRGALFPLIGKDAAYIFTFPSIVLAAVLGGWGPAVVVTVGGILATEILFLGPFGIQPDLPTLLRMSMILLTGLLLGSIGYGLRVLQFRAQARAQELQTEMAARERTQAQLRESERRFRGAFENAVVGITQLDTEGNWLMANDHFCEMLGYSRDALLKTEFSALTHPDDAANDRDLYQRLMRGEIENYALEKRYVRKDGQPVWVSLYRSLQRDENGRPAYSTTIVVDITERKAAEDRLRASESFYRQTLESIPGMVFTTRPDGYCDYQSQPWVDFTGVPMSEMVGDGWNKLLHPDDRASAFAAWRAAVAERAPYDLEYRVRRHDGQYRWFRVLARPIRDAEGQIIRWFGVALDIEDRKQAHEAQKRFTEELETRVAERTAQLQAAVEELQRSNEDLEKFAYISSHDLQEPLRMVALYVGLLVVEYKDRLDDRAREYIQIAEDGAVRMSQLIKDLLAYSRVNTQGQPLVPTNVNTVLKQVLESLRLAMEETGARVTHDNLPTIPADPTQLGQVFQNLIENAIKYRKDTEPPRIHISAERRDGQWLFCVRDNGIGIEEQYFDKIFVPFQRLHADRTKYPGTGIGLAIVKRIVERHHGRVRVKSTLGEGTTFCFTLPAAGP